MQQKCCTLPVIEPYLRIIRFQGYRRSRRKDNSSQGPYQRHQLHLRYRQRSMSWFRNLNRIPFRWVAWIIMHFKTELPYLLGSTNPCPTAVSMEPFSTSVFKVLTWIFATSTKICTRGRFTQHHCQGFFTDLHACLLVSASHKRWRWGMGTTLERHPFSGLIHSAGELLHTP
jgi:hypothetical protein